MKRHRRSAGATRHRRASRGLPIDSRLLSGFHTFGHVHGIARVFLVVEMVLSVLVVLGTLALVALGGI